MGSIINNKLIIILISMIWGFAFALFFRRTCQNGQCVVVKVPPTFHQTGDVIFDSKTNKCYQLQAYPSTCSY